MTAIKDIPEDFIVEELLPDGFIKKQGEYKVLLLTKRGENTEDRLQEIANKLHMPRRMIGYCGNKDRQAVTRQYITIRTSIWRNSSNIEELTHAGYSDESLGLGTNIGNVFTITVRDLKPDEKATKVLSIPNYFDEQRFSKNNAEIGKSIISKDFVKACKLACGSTGANPILQLRHIPQRQLLMYVHAYQSLLWNRTAYAFLVDKGKNAKRIAKGKTKEKTEGKTIEYSQGKLFFPSGKIADADIPLIGFATMPAEIKNPLLKKIITKILSEEKITPRDFIIPQMPEITSEGGERHLLIALTKFQLGKPVPDDLHPGKNKQALSFTIPKGSYATIVVKAMF